MKQRLLLAITLITIASTSVAKDLSTYILLNKEYRHLSQESSANKNTSTGVTDVDGFESRLGVKASQELEDGVTAKGKIELGINSGRDNGNADRIRIRLAQIDLSQSGMGTLTLGQHWNPNTLRMLKLDPLTGTGAQLLGLESADVTGASGGNFGMRARYFNDGVTYTSPSMSGFKVSMTADQNSDPLDQNADGNGQEWHTLVAAYDTQMGGNTLNTHLTYAMGDIENVAGSDLDNNQSFITLGIKYSAAAYGASFAYTMDNRGQIMVGTDKEDVQRTHMLLAAWYKMNKMTYAFNYGNTAFGDKENMTSTTTDNEGGSQTQSSLGAIYALSKNVKTRLIYRMQSIKTDGDDVIAGTSKTNDTSAVILGATASF